MANELDPTFIKPSGLTKKISNSPEGKNWGRIAKARERKAGGQLKATVMALWAEGANHVEIVESVNEQFELEGEMRVTPLHITKYVNKMLEFWKDKSLSHVDTKMAMTLTQYNLIEQMATEGYFASMKGKKTTNYKQKINSAKAKRAPDKVREALERERLAQGTMGIDEMKENVEVLAEEIQSSTMEQHNTAGDPTFLKILIDINYKRSQLWALLNRAEQISGDQEMAKLSDEARTERIASVIQQAKNRALGNQGLLAVPSPLGGFKEGEEPEGWETMSIDAVEEEEQMAQLDELNLDDLDWGDDV